MGLFRVMGLQCRCFLCFGGYVQFIEEKEDGALKKIEDICHGS